MINNPIIAGGVELPELTNPAAAGDTLTGKETITQEGEIQAGSMPERGAVDITLDANTPEYAVPDGHHDGHGKVRIVPEEKAATPSTAEQVLSPADGKVLSKVTVAPVPTQAKTVAPETMSQSVTPDTGKFLSEVYVEGVQTQEASAIPGAEAKEITPDIGKYFSKVTVEGDANLVPENIKKDVSVFGVVGEMVSADFEIKDCSRLFYEGSRFEIASNLLSQVKQPTTMYQMFYNCAELNSIDFSGIDTSEVTSFEGFLQGCTGLKGTLNLDLDTSGATTMANMFYGLSGVEEIDVSSFDTSKVTTMANMFQDCSKMKSIDISHFDVSNVTTVSAMFYDCAGLTSVDLRGLNFAAPVNLSSLFRDCSNMEEVFLGEIIAGAISYMFQGCKKLKSVDMSGVDTSQSTYVSNVFSSTPALESIIGFSAANKAGFGNLFPYGSSTSSRLPLKRLTFRTDLPDGTYSIRSAINIKYCSFTDEGLAEMFATLPDITSLNLSNSYKTITITGNPCVTDGTLQDSTREIATSRGWSLVE